MIENIYFYLMSDNEKRRALFDKFFSVRKLTYLESLILDVLCRMDEND